MQETAETTTPTSSYHRLNVYSYIDRFCGWEPFTEMLKYCGKYETFFLTDFKTGGRVSEALALTAENFSVDKPQNCLVVSNMPLEKRYKRNKETGITYKVHSTRKPFPILLDEQLSTELLSFVQSREGLLFPSPYKKGLKPFSRIRVYQVIREVTNALPSRLFRELGLNRPFLDEYGKEISDVIHLWVHWNRAQRASQLKAEYGFLEGDLMEWFSWLDFKTATHYAHLGYAGLADKMRKHL